MMRSTTHSMIPIGITASLLFLTGLLVSVFVLSGSVTAQAAEKRLITVYDRGVSTTFISEAKTLSEALSDNDIQLDPRDTVEPSRDEELVASGYSVNIYRARPVVVVDGSIRTKIMTPYQTAERIVADAGIPLYKEDLAVVSQSQDIIGDGAGLVLTIDRSVPITLDLYGRTTETRTRGDTVAAMLEEKEIILGVNGRTSLPLDTPITSGLQIRVWREGKQTISLDEAIPFAVEQIYDADRPLGYKAVQSEGANGVSSVTFEIEIKDGVELARTEIARITTVEPVKQTIVIGIKGMGEGLTQSKGAIQFTDSKGVVHRETYYDLDMGRVMQSCGQGGAYSIRIDGVKIDSDGYVIVAANYAKYPKCSVVETSVGPGKVYDTGGFVLRHPDGTDIATDWSNRNGR